MITPKNIKIGQRIDALVQKSKSNLLQKPKRPSISQRKQNAIPKTLEERVMASPYGKKKKKKRHALIIYNVIKTLPDLNFIKYKKKKI